MKFILIFKNLEDDKESECSYSLVDNPGLTIRVENIFEDKSLLFFYKFIEKANKYHMNESKKNSNLFSTSISSFQNKIYFEEKDLGKNEIIKIIVENVIKLKKGEKLKYFNNKLILNDNKMQSITIKENMAKIIGSEKSSKPIAYSEKNISLYLEKNQIIITELPVLYLEIESLSFLKDENSLSFTEKGIFIDNLSYQVEKNKANIFGQKYNKCLLRNGEELITAMNYDENIEANNKIKILYYNINEKLKKFHYSLNYSNNNKTLCLINNSLLCISVKTENNKYGIYVIDITNGQYEIYLTSDFKINYFCGMDNNSQNKDFVFAIGKEDNKWKIKLFKIYIDLLGIKIRKKEEIYESNNLINKIIYIEKNRKLFIV